MDRGCNLSHVYGWDTGFIGAYTTAFFMGCSEVTMHCFGKRDMWNDSDVWIEEKHWYGFM